MVLLYRCSDSSAITKDVLLLAIEVLLKSAGYMRREGFTGGATYEEIIQMSIHSQKAEFDTLISDMDYQRKDFTHLLQFHKDHAGGKALTDKALASLGFFDSNRKLANGSVLFRDNYSGGKTDIQLEISSPGSFFQGTALGKTYDLSGIISKRRNELICGILVHCNVMEAAGNRIRSCLQIVTLNGHLGHDCRSARDRISGRRKTQ